MDYEGPRTLTAIREALATEYDRDRRTTFIVLGEERIGSLVAYGKSNPLRPRDMPRTVYASRVNLGGTMLIFEGTSVRSVLNKLAPSVSRKLKERDEVAPADDAAAVSSTPRF